MSTLINGEPYVEILEPRRLYGEYNWITRKWTAPQYRYNLSRSPYEIKQTVYNSTKLNHLIRKLKEETGEDEGKLENEVRLILEEMSHSFDMKSIRFTGYMIAKIMKKIYTGIYVNLKGIEKAREVSTLYPILYMPTHRSYADFLLVSYICFNFNLPLPAIAAGLDFLGLKFVSTLLRNCGAFFIRRQFSDDKLYWSVFSIYLQFLLEGGEWPVEFFVEGTRSRSAKSLPPKLGLLQVAVELFLTAKLPDLTIIPISVSYERTLEEDLYAYELLGVPKPKESTTGLVKARKILAQNYGNIYVKFGDPISVRDFCGALDRSPHNLNPMNEVILSKEEAQLCSDLATHVVHVHQKNLVVPLVFVECLIVGSQGTHTSSELALEVEWIQNILVAAGFNITWSGHVNETQILKSVRARPKLFEVTSTGHIQVSNVISKVCADTKSLQPGTMVSQQTMTQALPHILMYHYSNQVLQLLVHYCMISMVLDCSITPISISEVKTLYLSLRRFMAKEFVFSRTNTNEDFEETIKLMANGNLIFLSNTQAVSLQAETADRVKSLARFLAPFLECYHLVCQFIVKESPPPMSCKKMANQCQLGLEAHVPDPRCLSLDMISNCLLMLIKEKAMHREKRENYVLIPIPQEIERISSELSVFVKKGSWSSIPTLVPQAKI